jgi:hypothetical protein
MYHCKCGKSYEKKSSLTSHARFCSLYEKEKIESIYSIENGYKCECGKFFEKHQSLNSHFSRCLIHRNGKELLKRGGWNLSEESRKKQGKTLSENILSGKTVSSFFGKKHKKESRERISEKMIDVNNGYIKTKFYEVYCKSMSKNVKLQGTWELDFSKRLDNLNIVWERDHKKNVIYYQIDGIRKKYLPDFYLPEFDLYVEIKGFWFKSKDGRVDDRRKMKLVILQNPDRKIQIIENIEDIRKWNPF